MLWKRLFGDNIWAHNIDELGGLNKGFKKMVSEHVEFKVLFLKDILTAADGTRKEIRNFVCTGSMGLRRHLTSVEIVKQVVYARQLLSGDIGIITNVVFMRMREPLHNIEKNVIKVANVMVHE
ncbi:hypothetical protein CRYUN_Cryun16bG0067400 [Craigia yunnanensis]